MKNKFIKDNIYIGIFSLMGASLEVQVKFSFEEKSNKNDTNNKDTASLNQDQELALSKLNKTVENTNVKYDLDIVKNNIESAFKWKYITEQKREHNKSVKESRINQVQITRKKLQYQNHQKCVAFLKRYKIVYLFIFYYYRWDVFRKQKEEERKFNDMVLKSKLFKRYWLKMKHTFDTMQIIYDIFDHKRQEKMLKDRQLY